jgi:prolyl-tRNA synthetase
MLRLGASKLALSSISHTDVWKKSERLKGKLEDSGHELIGLLDRKRSGLLLSPTHEEEITMLFQKYAFSYQDLPLRLYQICKFTKLILGLA